MMGREIYCENCKKSLGVYNVKYYSEINVAEIMRVIHTSHSRSGHHIKIIKKKYHSN